MNIISPANYSYGITVEHLIKDTIEFPSIQRTLFVFPNACLFLYTYNTFVASKKQTASLKRTTNLVPMCPLLGGSTIHLQISHYKTKVCCIKL